MKPLNRNNAAGVRPRGDDAPSPKVKATPRRPFLTDTVERPTVPAAVAPRPPSATGRRRHAAFTLLEVIIACAIFFMVAFAILEMVASGLKAARKLQVREPDPGIVFHALSLSNKWEEGSFSGTLEDIAPGMYPGYRFDGEAREIGSNGLWHADVMVYDDRNQGRNPSVISWTFWCPTCPPGSVTKGGL